MKETDTLHKTAIEVETSIAHYPPEVQPEVIWLAEYCRRACNSSFAVLARQARELGIKVSQNYLYQVISGRYFRTGGSPENLLECVAAFRSADRVATRRGRIPFVETSVWTSVRDYIDGKRDPENVCKFGVIAAETGTQKTACLREYTTRNNHGNVVRFEAPARPLLTRLMAKWGACYGIRSGWGRGQYLDHSLRQNLSPRKTAIIENAQRLYTPSTGARQELFSYLQEIQEDTGCTVILSWTRGFTRTFLGGDEAGFFEQFVGRMGGQDDILELPDYASQADLRTIALGVGLAKDDIKAALPILHAWSREPGRIRILFDRLQKAKRRAEFDGAELTLAHLELS